MFFFFPDFRKGVEVIVLQLDNCYYTHIVLHTLNIIGKDLVAPKHRLT